MVSGDSIAYVGGTNPIPIPRADDLLYRHAHTPPKPKPTGLDWDNLKPTCNDCGARSSDVLHGLCGICRDLIEDPARTEPKVAGIGSRAEVYVELDEHDVAAKFTALSPRPPLFDDLGDWTINRIPGMRISKSVTATAPGCPNGPHPTRDCACSVFTTVDEARAYIHAQLRGDVVTIGKDHFWPNPAAAEPSEKPAPRITPQVKAKVRQVSPDDIMVNLRGPGIAHRQTEIAALLADLLAALNPTPGYHFDMPQPGPATSEGGDQPGKPPPPSDRPARRRGTPRGKPVDEYAIVREYQGGDTAPTIGTRHGIRPKRVRDILDRHGIPLRDDRAGHSGGHNTRAPWTPEETADIVQRYQAGETTVALGSEYHCRADFIAALLRDQGITLRPPASTPRPLSDDEVTALCDDYQAGASIRDLQGKYRIARRRITSLLAEQGIELRPAYGPSYAEDQAKKAHTAAVRAWAMAHGLLDPTKTTGRLPKAALDAYAAAHPNQEESTPA